MIDIMRLQVVAVKICESCYNFDRVKGFYANE